MLKIQSSTECKFQVTGAKACSNKKQSKTAKLQAGTEFCSTKLQARGTKQHKVASQRDKVLQHKVASHRGKALQHKVASQRDKVLQHKVASHRGKALQHKVASQRDKVLRHKVASQRDKVLQHKSCKPQGQSFAAQSCSATQVAVHNVQICIIYIYIILIPIPIDIDYYRYRYRCGTNNTTVGEPKNSSLFPAHRNSQGSWLVWCVTPKYLSKLYYVLNCFHQNPTKKTNHIPCGGHWLDTCFSPKKRLPSGSNRQHAATQKKSQRAEQAMV